MHTSLATPALLLVFFTTAALTLSSSPLPTPTPKHPHSTSKPPTYAFSLPPSAPPSFPLTPSSSPKPSSSPRPPPPPKPPSPPPPPAPKPPSPPPLPPPTPCSPHPPPPPCPGPPSPPLPPIPYNGTCPADALKMNACIDMLAGLIHIGIGPEVKAFCCPVIAGISGIDAAVCICMIMTVRFLDLKVLIPIATQLLIYCGNAPPPGYHCPIPP